jgi:allantoinase
LHEFPNATEADLHRAMPILAAGKVPLLVHAELEPGQGHEERAEEDGSKCDAGDKWHDHRSYSAFVESRPSRWEIDAIELMIELSRQHKCPVHIVHLSAADALPVISAARKEGLPLTVETCPHYLTFAQEEIPDGDTRFKCTPPIRNRENREQLWRGLSQGLIDVVVSDHSPCVPHMKFLDEGDLKKAWGGISSLQFRLPAIWTEARKRKHSLEDLGKWLCSGPAELLGLAQRKGRLAAGFDADIVVFDPEAEVAFTGDTIFHRHSVTPYDGRKLVGRVERTYLRGMKIYDGKVLAAPAGQELLKQAATTRA